MRKTASLFLVVTAASLGVSPVAMALDLAGARAAGAVCEQPDGFVRALRPEATGLAGQVNSGRSAEYNRIAKQNNQTTDVAAKLAVPQILASGAKACP